MNKPTEQLTEVSKSVNDIIDFLDQLKTYTEAAVSEHDKAIQTITGAVVDETNKLQNQVRRLAKFVLLLMIVTVGMVAYLCFKH